MLTLDKSAPKQKKTILAEFYPYTNLKLTIRNRGNRSFIRMSDILSDAPEKVLVSAANVIISQQLRVKCDKEPRNIYRNYIYSEKMRKRLNELRTKRATKRVIGYKGKYHDLKEYFNAINSRYFENGKSNPTVTWSAGASRSRVGHFDSDLNTLVVSRRLDKYNTPRYVIEYVIYHEMLHWYYPGKYVNGRWCVHRPEFKRAEIMFEDFERAKKWLKNRIT